MPEMRPPTTRLHDHRGIPALFLASRFSAVACQVILSRYVQLIVGSTAYAISALLVAFMLRLSHRVAAHR
jgi:hypothetical protein